MKSNPDLSQRLGAMDDGIARVRIFDRALDVKELAVLFVDATAASPAPSVK